MRYGVNGDVVDMIARIYSGDMTEIHLKEDLKEIMEITSGIRQGCTGSSVLFRIITYMIIESLEEVGEGFRNEQFSITSLFFADDGLVMATNVE
jgi:hypothetical protein